MDCSGQLQKYAYRYDSNYLYQEVTQYDLFTAGKDGAEIVPNDFRGLSGIDTTPKALCFVEIGNWASLSVVSG